MADAGDWAALARYRMAHGPHAPALDTAIVMVRHCAARGAPPWPALAWLRR